MATTSIWSVKGWLGKLVLYVENPEKTTNPDFYKKDEITSRESQELSDVIEYAINSEKTKGVANENEVVVQNFVSGVNCYPATARDEMLAIKRRFGKDEGVMAYHGYQSFAPGEVTPGLAHQIGVELANELWGEKYQVIVATHLDKEHHLHNHFVVNTVSFIDGIRYYRSEKDYYQMRQTSDRLCKEHELSVIEKSDARKTMHYGEWRAYKEQRPTWRGIVREDIDRAILTARTERQFFENLKKMNYEVKVGKDISVRPPGKERFVRLVRNYGEEYSIEQIREYILSHPIAERPLPAPVTKKRRYRMLGDYKKTRKITGFRALYFHYCYKLGIFPSKRPVSKKRIHFLFREDLRKLDTISKEVKLLCGHRIDTAEQLSLYKAGVENRIHELISERKELYRAVRTKAVATDEARSSEVKAQTREISKELSLLRKEVRLCDDIFQRSGIIKEKLKTVREDEKREEKVKDEHIRGRSRASR
ncbi:hypothetical protein M2150_001800 [Lachnospiraceae bacterium PM6-15]|uniref:relaxase/mobilization nuclease domain-containing protein n=1 Tax=Ohessyouella blattaphilus TaxID=2949333 RepID=UPI003E2BB9C0